VILKYVMVPYADWNLLRLYVTGDPGAADDAAKEGRL
jgi:hypothetical protein